MGRRTLPGLILGLIGSALVGVVLAEDAPPDPRAWGIQGQCIDSHRMRNIRFRDDQSAIIEITGGKQILMTLERRCPGIRRRGFLHETRINKLCTSDVLRVMDTGASCLIKDFSPYLAESDKADSNDER